MSDGQFLKNDPPLKAAMSHFLARARGPRQSYDPGDIHGIALVLGSQNRELKNGDFLIMPVVKPVRWVSWIIDVTPVTGEVTIGMEHATYDEFSERIWVNAMEDSSPLEVTRFGVNRSDAPNPTFYPNAILEWDRQDAIKLTVTHVGHAVERAIVCFMVYELPNPVQRHPYMVDSEGRVITNSIGHPVTNNTGNTVSTT